VKLQPRFTSFPADHPTPLANEQAFHAVANHSNVAGAIDCTHILIKARQQMKTHKSNDLKPQGRANMRIPVGSILASRGTAPNGVARRRIHTGLALPYALHCGVVRRRTVLQRNSPHPM